MSISTIAVAGAGTMGSGIAMACAMHGFKVVLFDADELVVNKAKASITEQLELLAGKKKITSEHASATANNLSYTSHVDECKADLIIEAIIENAAVKVGLLKRLAAINQSTTIIASNTSSISITTLQNDIELPGRVAGLHFFNPASIMKLVEIVKGDLTNDATINALQSFCEALNKTAVLCKDSPGFIVNRVARHYYLEALRLVEQGVADVETIDTIMQDYGFKMGPFQLMDIIGIDINLSVSTSLYEAFDKAPRFKPSAIQQQKVNNGELGKKTGKGFYDHSKVSS